MKDDENVQSATLATYRDVRWSRLVLIPIWTIQMALGLGAIAYAITCGLTQHFKAYVRRSSLLIG